MKSGAKRIAREIEGYFLPLEAAELGQFPINFSLKLFHKKLLYTTFINNSFLIIQYGMKETFHKYLVVFVEHFYTIKYVRYTEAKYARDTC